MLDKLSGHMSQHWIPRQFLGHKQMCIMGSVCVCVLWGSLILLSSKLLSLNQLFCFYCFTIIKYNVYMIS